MKVKILPPADFYQIRPKEEIDKQVVKRKLTENINLSRLFLLISLNSPIRLTQIQEELKKVLKCQIYETKTKRWLKTLVDSEVVESVNYCDINFEETTDLENKIISRHNLLLKMVKNPNSYFYKTTVYYFLTPFGEEILPFVAKYHNFSVIEHDDEAEIEE